MLCLVLVLALTACVGPISASQQVPHAAGIADARRTPAPTAATATPTPEPSTVNGRQVDQTAMNDAVSWYLEHMTLDQKLGQLFLIETVWTGYNADVDNMVHGMHAGAMIIYNQNMTTQAQLTDFIATIQAHADLPMLVSTDQEGGVVNRLLPFIGLQPSAQDMASSGNPDVARQLGAQWAHDLLALGVNTDLAPVVDVRTDPAAIEFTRLFGDDPATVDRFAGAFLQGVQDAGVIGTLKHWPGIGSVTLDPHDTLPTITRTKAQLEATDFAAFRDLLADRPGMIMVTHVIVQSVDPTRPATLSPAVVNGVLRGELGYQGVVMTDSLYMAGISVRYSLGEAAVLSILAGDDLLEGAWDTNSMREMLDAIKAALASGRLTEDRINQSVRRILALKIRFGLLPLHPYHLSPGNNPSVASPLAAAMDAALPSERWV
jgi:beta-N-acetylhexosaminidase